MAKHVSDGPDSKPSGHHVSLCVSVGAGGVELPPHAATDNANPMNSDRTVRDYFTWWRMRDQTSSRPSFVSALVPMTWTPASFFMAASAGF